MALHFNKLALVGALSASLLAACGGGGGGYTAPTTPPAVESTSSFALSAGYKARIVNGATDNFNITGDAGDPNGCEGTASIKTEPAAVFTFEGVAGHSSAQTSTVNFTKNCLPPTKTVTGKTFYNNSYVPIGQSIDGGDYSKFQAPPADLPAMVKVNDTGSIATLNTFTDSTATVATGKRVLSYEIKADTSTTVLTNIITRTYDAANNLLVTQTSSYRTAVNGSLALVLIDVQFSSTSTIHLIYTPT